MCEPALIALAAGAALSAGGAAYNSNVQSKAIKAQSRATNDAEMARQMALSEERRRQKKIDQANFDEVRAASRAIAPDQRADEIQIAARDPENTVQAAANRYAPMPLPVGEDGEIIGDAKSLGEAARRNSAMIDALAVLSAQGTDQGATGDRFGRLSANLAQNDAKGRRSLRVNQIERAVPTPRVTPSSSALGDVMLAGGGALSSYGGSQFDGLDGSWFDDLRRPFITPSGAMHGGGR